MALDAIGVACPDNELLEALASGAAVAVSVTTHVARCHACRTRLAQIESDNALIAEFRSAVVAPERQAPPTIGGSIGDYQLMEEIGRGGQGVVYRALDQRTGRSVALKMLREGALASFHHRRRFDREIEIVAGLRHPGIVTLYEAFDVVGGGRAIAMEYVDGKPLDRWCESKRGAVGDRLPREVLDVLIAVCDAVHHAHLRGVIHRDLKPSNILVDSDGRPRVLDFGIAKVDDASGDSTFTTGFVGSAGYAAPEQILGSPADVDLRADLFALGAIGYQVFCGSVPFPGRGRVTELAGAVRDEPLPELPSHLCETASRSAARDLDAVLRKALAPEPERRYRSAVELRDDLVALRDGDPVNARPEDFSYLVRRAMRRHRWAAAATLAVAATLILSTTTFAALWRGAEDRSRYQLSFDVMVQMIGTMNPDLDPDGRGSLVGEEAAQVRESAPRIEQLIDAAKDDPVREATLRHGWAHLLSSGLRDHKPALAHARQAVALRDHEARGADSVLKSIELLAVIQLRMERYEEAIETLDSLLKRIAIAHLPPEEDAALRGHVTTLLDVARSARGGRDALSAIEEAKRHLKEGDIKKARDAVKDAADAIPTTERDAIVPK